MSDLESVKWFLRGFGYCLLAAAFVAVLVWVVRFVSTLLREAFDSPLLAAIVIGLTLFVAVLVYLWLR